MKILERGFITVTPTKKFIDWANNNDEDYRDLVSNEGNVYLVEEDVYDDEVLLKSKFKEIFMNELQSVSENESQYPEITWDSFNTHFEVSFGSCVFDLMS